MQKYHGPIFGAKTIPTTYYISYIAVGKNMLCPPQNQPLLHSFLDFLPTCVKKKPLLGPIFRPTLKIGPSNVQLCQITCPITLLAHF